MKCWDRFTSDYHYLEYIPTVYDVVRYRVVIEEWFFPWNFDDEELSAHQLNQYSLFGSKHISIPV